MPDQPVSAGAVFLSYASEDAEAAGRLCEALRSAGIEVWFDREDLRGGDAWDSKIKRQIHECALFMPLISGNTDARTEGYFRREWKLAAHRLLDIADDAAFLVPVVIDATAEAHARVPEEFLGVHWTRLPGGNAPLKFVQHVRQLLGLDPAVDPAAHAAATTTVVRGGAHRAAGSRGTTPHQRWIAGAVTTLLALGLGGGLWWYYQGKSDAPSAIPPATTAPPAATTAAVEKSIAVLPFTDMSAEKNQEYMADGIADELLNLLSQVPNLKVIARTSSFSFKGQQIDIGEIARRLGVAHILEGSVRTSGDHVRVTVQLIRAADGTQVWSARYDRPLDNIFDLQDEIANAIVQALQISLSGGSVNRQLGGTENLAAYRLYLQAGNAFAKSTEASLNSSDDYLQQAIALDPQFGRAWARRAVVVARQAAFGYITTEQFYRDYRHHIETALNLSPENAEAHVGLARLHMLEERDWSAAERDVEHALASDPNSAVAFVQMSWIRLAFGDLGEAERYAKLAVSRDPQDPGFKGHLADIYYASGQFDEAERVVRSVLDQQPDRPGAYLRLSKILLAQRKPEAALEALQQESNEAARSSLEPVLLQAVGRQAEADDALARLVGRGAEEWAVAIAQAYAFRGDIDRTMKWLERADQQKDIGILEVLDEPLFNKVVEDPRYQAFVREKLKINRKEFKPVG